MERSWADAAVDHPSWSTESLYTPYLHYAIWWRVKNPTQNRSLVAEDLDLMAERIKHCRMLNRCSRVRLFATPWTVACQAPLSMGFSRQEYWSGLPCPRPGDLPDPGIESASPSLAGGFFTSSTTWEAQSNTTYLWFGLTMPQESEQIQSLWGTVQRRTSQDK